MCEGNVKVPKDVAESIDLLSGTDAGKVCLCDIPYMIKCVEKELPDASVFGPIVKFYLANSENKTIYFQAVTNGYEAEETSEEKVARYYLSLKQDYEQAAPHSDEIRCVGFEMQGIAKTLGILGIKIKGVNS